MNKFVHWTQGARCSQISFLLEIFLCFTMQLKLYQPYETAELFYTIYINICGASLHLRVTRQPALESKALHFSTSNFQHDNVPSSFPRAGHHPMWSNSICPADFMISISMFILSFVFWWEWQQRCWSFPTSSVGFCSGCNSLIWQILW